MAHPGEWQGAHFQVVDTGGMFGASEDPLHALVFERGQRALREADLLVLVVDGREGLVPGDRDIAKVARETNRPVILVINKMDDKRAKAGALEFYQLGIEPVFEVSSEHGQGVGDLLDAIVELEPRVRVARAGARADAAGEDPYEELPEGVPAEPLVPDEVSVTIVGRPNAGKSSLVNRLLREERMIVSEVPGTTRDAVDTVMTWHKRQFRIVDTAGMRRPGRVASSGQVESISVLLARRSMEHADVVVLVLDAQDGATDQDAAIAGEADRLGCGVIIVANKWDLMKGQGPEFVKAFDEGLRRQLKFLDYAPILHISALTGERAPKLLEHIDRVAASRRSRVKTHELNKLVERVSLEHPPQSPGKRHVRILYAAQTAVAPPTFVFFTNVATNFHFSYERFLVNQIREAFGFDGTPIRVLVRTRRRKGAEAPSRA
jgi:GTP-binding protein